MENFQSGRLYYSAYHDHPNLKPLVLDFAREVGEDVALIENDCRGGEAKKAAAQVHRLKGTAATYGFPVLASKLQEIERHIPNFQEDPATHQQLLDELLELQRISEEIARVYHPQHAIDK